MNIIYGLIGLTAWLSIVVAVTWFWFPPSSLDAPSQLEEETDIQPSLESRLEVEIPDNKISYKKLQEIGFWSLGAINTHNLKTPEGKPVKATGEPQLLSITTLNQQRFVSFKMGEKVERITRNEQLSNGWKLLNIYDTHVVVDDRGKRKELRQFTGQ